MTELVLDGEHYSRLVRREIPAVRRSLWIATADIKDLFTESDGDFVPLLRILAEKVGAGVEVRLLHAKEPGPRFRADFDRHPVLFESPLFERALCPRVHMKVLIFDRRLAYAGSANLTGAGLGARGATARNFEAGFLTTESVAIQRLESAFNGIFMGERCAGCRLRDKCPDPIAP